MQRPEMSMMSKKSLSETDICTKYITPAVIQAGWDEALLAKSQDEGAETGLDNIKILAIPPLNTMGTPIQLIKQFSSRASFEQAVHEPQAALYQEVF